jgi:hypothetical protein
MATVRLGMIFMLRTSTSCVQFCKLQVYTLLVCFLNLRKADGMPLNLASESTVFTIVL